MCDGVVFVLEVVEVRVFSWVFKVLMLIKGINSIIENKIIELLENEITFVLYINKLDRLICELQLSPIEISKVKYFFYFFYFFFNIFNIF